MKSTGDGFKYKSMVAQGWGLAQVGRPRDARRLSQTGRGGPAATAAQPGCLDLSQVPGEDSYFWMCPKESHVLIKKCQGGVEADRGGTGNL